MYDLHKKAVDLSLVTLVVSAGVLLSFLGQPVWVVLFFGAFGLVFLAVTHSRGRAVHALKSQLERSQEEADLAVQTRTTFLANITHDLRAPLGNVLLLVATLERELHGELTEKQRDAVGKIADNSRHVMDVLNNLLDLAKIEAARLELTVVSVHLLAVIDSALRLVYDQAAEKGLALEEPDPMFEVWVEADEFRLKQVLVNLLVNAVKFTPPGGRVGVRVEREDTRNEVAITVWDTGPGISPDAQEKIFEPFVQLHREAKGKCGEAFCNGAGLGLALVKRIIDQHGGRITLASEPGLGCAFELRLQRAKSSRSSRRRQASSSGSLPALGHSVGV